LMAATRMETARFFFALSYQSLKLKQCLDFFARVYWSLDEEIRIRRRRLNACCPLFVFRSMFFFRLWKNSS
jgi:hypothetical protein